MNQGEAVTGAQHWVGIDVSKRKLDVALMMAKGKMRNRVFPNDAGGYAALVAWVIGLAGSDGLCACMEATGPYSEGVATALFDAGWHVSVVNPARVKGFAQGGMTRNKTDDIDAGLIARFAERMQPDRWTAPTPQARALNALVGRLQDLEGMVQQERNREEGAQGQEQTIESIRTHVAWLQERIKELQKEIDDHIDRHPGLRGDVELMTSIPGVGNKTASKFVAIVGDLRRFKSAKALSAFIGVTPRLKESGSSVRGRSVISRMGHSTVRSALFMPAMVAQKHNHAMKAFSARLKANGLAPKAIVCACMHKLVHFLYAVVTSGVPFDPKRYLQRLDIQDGI